jgi:hypothetical protein
MSRSGERRSEGGLPGSVTMNPQDRAAAGPDPPAAAGTAGCCQSAPASPCGRRPVRLDVPVARWPRRQAAVQQAALVPGPGIWAGGGRRADRMDRRCQIALGTGRHHGPLARRQDPWRRGQADGAGCWPSLGTAITGRGGVSAALLLDGFRSGNWQPCAAHVQSRLCHEPNQAPARSYVRASQRNRGPRSHGVSQRGE